MFGWTFRKGQFHLYAIPYCSVAIVERDLANVLAQIKRHDAVLHGTDIRDISFIRQLGSPGAAKA